jgi:hypothetical protein
MKPGQWTYWSDPGAMLETIRRDFRHRASARKLRLLGCACFHRAWHLLTDPRARRVVQLSELVADGLASQEELNAAVTPLIREVHQAAVDAFEAAHSDPIDHRDRDVFARLPPPMGASYAVVLAWTTQEALVVRGALEMLAVLAGEEAGAERRAQCHLIRDVFGNPFKPVAVDPAWLRWNNGFVANMAQVIYDDYTFGDLPILADALEEAGCDNKDVLQHCRSRKDHVRGCWVIDSLLRQY